MAIGDVYYNTAQFLIQNGYTEAAASGISGDIAGESAGNPEATGPGDSEGLIQWTPGSTASPYYPIVTGDEQSDYSHQLQDILAYNKDQGTANLNLLNAQTDPVSAAEIYSKYFERPKDLYSDVNSGVANQVYQELGAGSGGNNSATNNTYLTSTVPTDAGIAGTSELGTLLGFPDFNLSDVLERLGLILLGGLLILIGVYMLAGKQILQMTPLGEMTSHSGRQQRANRATSAQRRATSDTRYEANRATSAQRRATSDTRYEAAEARRKSRESRQTNTGDMEERRLSLRERRVRLAEQTEERKRIREAANP
jgi:Phage tail lysozyme